MKIIQSALALSFLILSFVSISLGQEKPGLREVDRVRLAEAFNLGEKLRDDLWAGASPNWRSRYLAEKFDNEKYFRRVK